MGSVESIANSTDFQFCEFCEEGDNPCREIEEFFTYPEETVADLAESVGDLVNEATS